MFGKIVVAALLASGVAATCWSEGWRTASITEDFDTECPAGTNARTEHDLHTPATGIFNEAECCQTSCWIQGWRDASTVEDFDTECPAGKNARSDWDMHNPGTGNFNEDQCCLSSCWSEGWRDAGTAAATNECPASTNARTETDMHNPGTGNFDEGQCCQTSCWGLGWRAAGSGAELECPADTEVRGPTDFHNPGSDNTAHSMQCCQATCQGWGAQTGQGACPAGTSLATGHYCPTWGDQGCTSDSCCKPTCQNFADTTGCGADKMDVDPSMTCPGESCMESDCCMDKPSQDMWNCWYHGDTGEGWRDNGDTSGTQQCPVGLRARPSHDRHRGMNDGQASYSESDCCKRTCWADGWRDDGDASGSKQCQASASARNQEDGHDCDFDCDASECCQVSCAASGFATAGACPDTATFKGESHNCGEHELGADGLCTQQACCPHTCGGVGFTQDRCSSGMTLFVSDNDWQQLTCNTADCSSAECCYLQVSDSTCWEAGYRSSTAVDEDGTTTYKCAAGMNAREENDGHKCGNGWNGHDSGKCFAGDCCGFSCSAFPEADCPAGTQHVGSDGSGLVSTLNADSCCHVSCGVWAAGGNTCSSDKKLKNDMCAGGLISGCTADTCCEEKGACHEECDVTVDFDNDCNSQWSTSLTECNGATECQPEGCSTDASEATDACKPGLELCRTCTPSVCAACVECYAGIFNHVLSVLSTPTASSDSTPTFAPTEAPTIFPTFAPTEAATNPPLPEYVAANFDTDSFAVVTNIASVTASPTDAPTSAPTHAGYEIVETEVEKKVLQVELTFPVSAEEAANPVMQKSLEAGFANAIGLDPSSVRVSSVGGVTVRRRLVDTAIEFEITSNSDDTAQADALKANVETAVTSGSVVANVQKEASINGVLTADLNTMVRALAAPTVTVATVIVTVATQQRAPTAAPTTAETEDSLSAASGAGSVSALAVALAILAAFPAL